MAKAFLDASYLLDIFMRHSKTLRDAGDNDLYISPLSIHIATYVQKLQIPNAKLVEILRDLEVVNFSGPILKRALIGPTADLEDNIQLHSAAKAACDYFFTTDKKLLNLGFFGTTKIVDSL